MNLMFFLYGEKCFKIKWKENNKVWKNLYLLSFEYGIFVKYD